MEQTVYKSGSSLVVVVPSEFAGIVGVKTGDSVDVLINYKLGTVRYRFSGAKQLTLSSVSADK